MTREHSIVPASYQQLLVDAGQVRINYVDADNPGFLLGATRGGAAFTIEQEIHRAEVDGAKGPVKGDARVARVNARIQVSMIEIVPWVLSLGLTGSTTLEDASHSEIKRALSLLLTNYNATVALIGQVIGMDEPVICIIRNALSDGGIDITLVDNEESVVKIQFSAHFDPDTMDEEPWVVRYPWDNPFKLRGWWKGENNTVDSTGGNDATWSGAPHYIAGAVGFAFDFWAVGNNFLMIPYNAAQCLTATNTWVVEFYFTKETMGSATLFRRSNANSSGNDFFIEYTDNGNNIAIVVTSANDSVLTINYPGVVSPNTRYKLKAKSTAGVWQLWINGAEKTASGPATKIPRTNTTPFKVAGDSNHQIIDELKIFTDNN